MLESVFVYGLLTLVMVVCGLFATRRESVYEGGTGVYEKNNQFLQPEILVIIAAFTFVFGCRYGVGVDYFHYLIAYLRGSERTYGFLFQLFSDIMSKHNFHFAIYFSFWAFLQIFLLLYAFRNYRFIFPYLLLYLIIGNFFLSMMNIIRQQIAALIFLNSIQFIEEKKPIMYYICVLFAFFFHNSAVLMIIMYPILRFKSDWFQSVIIQLILLVIAIYLSYRFDLIMLVIRKPFVWFASTFGFDSYRMSILGNETIDSMGRFGTNTGYGIFIALFKCLPIIFFSKSLKEYYHSSFFDMLYSMWFVRVFTSFAFGDSIILNRPFVYFSNVSIVMVAFFTYFCFKSKKTGNLLIGIAMIMVYMAMFLYILYNGELNTSAYTFFWQH